MRDLGHLVSFVQADPGLRSLRAEAEARLDGDPGHDLAHALRVALLTVRLGGAEVDPRRAVAAALFHDVVNVPKDAPDRHLASTRSAEVAAGLLRARGYDAAFIEDVCLAIRDHSWSRGCVPGRPLGKALQDADRLEALGALGLFRTISTGTRMGARYFDPEDPFAEARPLDDRAHTVDHFFVKLLHLKSAMNTEAGRCEAERRTLFLEAFLTQLSSELGQPLPLK